MPTPVFLTGFEHGVVVTGATPSPNDRIWHAVATTGGTPGIDTTTPKSGARCLNIPASSGAASYVQRNVAGSPTIGVASFYVRFVGSLPTADCRLFTFSQPSGAWGFLKFVAADSKLYPSTGAANGSTGFSVVPDVWYLVDFKVNCGANPLTVDVTIDGTALAQLTIAQAASTLSTFRIGKNVDTSTANGNIRYDDLVISTGIAGDYPMGAHEVLKMSPNGDGTHSFTANDFIRGDAGAAILVTDTDVWTLVDDVPFAAIGTTDSVQQNVIRTTGYVELALEAAPRTINAWGIQVHGQYDADATGADQCTLKLNDGGTLADLYTNADVSNTSETFLTHQRATAPSSGAAWTQAKLDALLLRWGFSGDVTGSPIVHALMVEVAYPITGTTFEGAAADGGWSASLAVAGFLLAGAALSAGFGGDAAKGGLFKAGSGVSAPVTADAVASGVIRDGRAASEGWSLDTIAGGVIRFGAASSGEAGGDTANGGLLKSGAASSGARGADTAVAGLIHAGAAADGEPAGDQATAGVVHAGAASSGTISADAAYGEIGTPGTVYAGAGASAGHGIDTAAATVQHLVQGLGGPGSGWSADWAAGQVLHVAILEGRTGGAYPGKLSFPVNREAIFW